MPVLMICVFCLCGAFVFSSDAPAVRPDEIRFTKDENPISQDGAWVGAKSAGVDWADVRTTGSIACGAESGSGGYDDSTALLKGTFKPDQMAQATVHSVNQKGGDIYEEVELRLRSALSPHRCTGYEINFRCVGHDGGYNQIVRWNGKLGDFKILSSVSGGVADGDVIKAAIIGNKITVYRNGVEVNHATDDAFTKGNPGVGFFLQGGNAKLDTDYGFTSFFAQSIEPTTQPGR